MTTSGITPSSSASLGEPSVTGVYGAAWERLKQYFLELLLVSIVWVVLGIPAGLWSSKGNASVLGGIYHLLVLGPASFGLGWSYLRAARGESPEVVDLFAPFQRCYWASVLAYLLVCALVTAGFIAFLIPGIFLAVRLSFVPFLVVDERLDAVAAVKESWRRTAPVGWTILGVEALGLVVCIFALLLLVVGTFFAAMWVYLAVAVLFAQATANARAATSSVTPSPFTPPPPSVPPAPTITTPPATDVPPPSSAGPL